MKPDGEWPGTMGYMTTSLTVPAQPMPAHSRIQWHFSPRERDVVSLLLDGRSNAKIARELGISLHSAKRHVSAVLKKVNSPEGELG